MARRLIREEGLLVGGSSGAAMIAALKVAKTLKAGQRLVVILADSVRNYMSKFLNDGWMIENGFLEDNNKNHPAYKEWWSDRAVAELKLETPFTVSPTVTCQHCIDILNKTGYDQLPCVREDGEIEGMVTMGNLASYITTGRVQATDPIANVLYRQFKKIPITTKLAELSKLFDKDHFALVVSSQRCFSGPETVSEKTVVFGIVTRIDLLNYIVNNRPKH